MSSPFDKLRDRYFELYLFRLYSLAVKGTSTRLMQYRLRNRQEQRGARPRDLEQHHQDIEIYSTLFSLVSTEVLFYPFETILHRMQLQGTRTIIDNLDSGYSVVPILTSYEGAVDCYRSTLGTEGVSGLYKGFGAMLLQFAAHVAVIKLTKWVVTQITEVYSSRPSSKVAEFYNLEHQEQQQQPQLKQSHSLRRLSPSATVSTLSSPSVE